MKVLVFHTANSTAKDLESLASEFIKDGHDFFLLTLSSEGVLHKNIIKLGGKAFSISRKGGLWSRTLELTVFCRKHKIDILYSNLQPCSIIAIVAQFFISAQVFTYRHHSDSVALFGTLKEKLADTLINKLAKKIIVISKTCFEQVVNMEHVNPEKVKLIPLGYDFSLFPSPNVQNVLQIREKNNCSMLLVVVGRLIPLKRVNIAVDVVAKLRIEEKKDVKLLILGDGETYQQLNQQIQKYNAESFIKLEGYVENVLDYISASDVLIHTSCSEASCHMPKEAGVLEKPIIVCEGVGDFSDYIKHEENGLLMSADLTEQDLIQNLLKLYNHRSEAIDMGTRLKSTVQSTFDIKFIKKLHYKIWKDGY